MNGNSNLCCNGSASMGANGSAGTGDTACSPSWLFPVIVWPKK